MTVEIVVLGEVAASVRGRPVDLGPAKQRCVLAALAVEVNRVVSDDRLIDRVWGADPPRRARATLASYVSRLRRMLSPAEDETGTSPVAVARRAGGYVLVAEQSAVDLHRFRGLVARARREVDDGKVVELLTGARGLVRGPALSGLTGEWAQAQRDRLDQERLGVECDLADARLRLGHNDLVAELAARAAEHPLDERVAAQYLLALYRADRAAAALEHYQRVRERLVDELGSEPGEAMRTLHQRVLRADPDLSAPVAPPRLARTAMVPRQLLSAPVPFVGRADELAALDAAPHGGPGGGTVVITAIAGAGGIGKTWLALHWAHRHLDRFPDGQLFVDLRGFSQDDEPMHSSVAVRGFLDALGIRGGAVPSEPHAQAALFRSLVAGRRMLLLLDNAVDTAQIAPLLPGGDLCTVVVTSRYRLLGLFTGHGAAHLTLDVLPDDDVHVLLADRIGARRVADDRAAVRALIALCGGFPLAVAVVAGRARTEPDLSLTALVDQLREVGLDALADDDPTASLPAVLSWSYRALPADQARAFALLGVAPGPDIGVHAAASLIGSSPTRAKAVLDALEHASLVSRDDQDRYRMHDLVRRYAVDRAEEDVPAVDRVEAQRRVVDSLLHAAHAADRVLDPERPPVHLVPPAPGAVTPSMPDGAGAMAWFDAEHPCLLAAQRTAVAQGWHERTWQVAWVLGVFHQRRGHLHDLLAVWQAGLAACDYLADTGHAGYAHRILGRTLAEVGRSGEAMVHLQQALALAERDEDHVEQVYVHRALSQVWSRLDDRDQAFRHAELSLGLSRASDDPVRTANALNLVGWCAAQVDDHATALRHCEAALAVFQAHGYRTGEADTHDSLGFINHDTGNHVAAVRHYERAVALFREAAEMYVGADSLRGLGHSYAALGDHGRARAAWLETAELYDQQHREDDAADVREHLDQLPSSPHDEVRGRPEGLRASRGRARRG